MNERSPEKPHRRNLSRERLRTAQPCLGAQDGRAAATGVAWSCHPTAWCFVKHDRAGRRGAPVPNLWNFRAMSSDHFGDFKLASLALLSANYHQSLIHSIELLKIRKDVE